MLKVTLHAGLLEDVCLNNMLGKLEFGYTKLAAVASYKAELLTCGVGAHGITQYEDYPRWSASIWDLVMRLICRALHKSDELPDMSTKKRTGAYPPLESAAFAITPLPRMDRGNVVCVDSVVPLPQQGVASVSSYAGTAQAGLVLLQGGRSVHQRYLGSGHCRCQALNMTVGPSPAVDEAFDVGGQFARGKADFGVHHTPVKRPHLADFPGVRALSASVTQVLPPSAQHPRAPAAGALRPLYIYTV